MALFDKFKKNAGEEAKISTSPNKPKNLTSTGTMSSEDLLTPINSIRNKFKQNEDYIFNEIIWKSLFSDNNKYSDTGIFEKSEVELKNYFNSIGFDWSNNLEIIKKLIYESDKFKNIRMQLETNYKYYITNRMNFRFEEHFSDWLKIVIDRSISEKRPLTKQYARMVVGDYYFKEFSLRGSKDSLYRNLISMISAEEFKTWISNDELCFDNLVTKVIKRFKKIEVVDLDERVIVTQIVKSKLFIQALKDYDYLDKCARISKYSSIYVEVSQNLTSNKIDLNIKNIITETKHPVQKTSNHVMHETTVKSETEENNKQIVKTNNEKKCSKVFENDSVVDTSSSNQQKLIETKNETKVRVSKTKDEFEELLINIGGTRTVENNSIVEFLTSIEEELKQIDFGNYEFSFNTISSNNDLYFDEEIEQLDYY